MRVLLLEDDVGHAEMSMRCLVRAGLKPEAKRVETEADFVASLHANVDVVLSDFNIPGFSGLQALQLLKQRDWDIPFIIVSGNIGEEAAVQAMRLGAADFLRKERLEELPGTVLRALEQRRLREEHRRAERKVREQAALLDLAQDAIIVQDYSPRRIAFWNHGAQLLYGWTKEEALGRDPAELFASPQYMRELENALLAEGEWRGETVQTTKDGVELSVIAKATLLRSEAGEPRSVLLINTDITEQKRLQAQIFRAQRLESIGTLASGVAHDLSNVLSPVLMSVPLLRMDLPAGVKEELISTIQSCAERGGSILRQVLTFARGGLTGQSLVSPVYVAKEVAKIIHGTFPKSIALATEYPEKIWHIQGDATQLQQVLLNLCVNARDAMPEGGDLSLRVLNQFVKAGAPSTLHPARIGPCVVLEVTDSGSGIPPEILEKIFDPFFTTKASGQGTGLGLASVAGIVKSHSGFIHVARPPYGGTSFRVFLPAVEDGVEQPADREAAPPNGHGELVLLVDDESPIRNITGAILERSGYRVLGAANGHDAIALFVQHQAEIAVVLTDLMMPLMDGLTLARTLRRLSPTVHILASIGETDKPYLSELESLGVPPPLRKPYSAEKLLTVLAETLAHP